MFNGGGGVLARNEAGCVQAEDCLVDGLGNGAVAYGCEGGGCVVSSSERRAVPMGGEEGDRVGVPLEEWLDLGNDVEGVGGEGGARRAVSDRDEVVLWRCGRPRLPETAAMFVPRVGKSLRGHELVEARKGHAGSGAYCEAYFSGPTYGIGAARQVEAAGLGRIARRRNNGTAIVVVATPGERRTPRAKAVRAAHGARGDVPPERECRFTRM